MEVIGAESDTEIYAKSEIKTEMRTDSEEEMGAESDTEIYVKSEIKTEMGTDSEEEMGAEYHTEIYVKSDSEAENNTHPNKHVMTQKVDNASGISRPNTHILTPTGQKLLACTLCEYNTTISSNLKRHTMRLHTGEKPFACSLCEHMTTTSYHLKRHMQTHTRVKTFACTKSKRKKPLKTQLKGYANYSVSRYSDRRRDMPTHMKDKLFVCSLCHQPTTTDSALKTHIMTHTKENTSHM